MSDKKTEQDNKTENTNTENTNKGQQLDKEALLKEFLKENTIQVPFIGLNLTLKSKAKLLAKDLDLFFREALDKKNEFAHQSELLKRRMGELIKTGKWNVDKDEYEKTQKGIKKYEALLDSLLKDIEGQLSFFTAFTSDNPPEKIELLKFIASDIDTYFESKIKDTRKFIKNMQKDLRISFSRYNFSFDAQIKHLNYVYAYIKHMEKNKS